MFSVTATLFNTEGNLLSVYAPLSSFIEALVKAFVQMNEMLQFSCQYPLLAYN
jgi:hypothetical protein